MLLELTQVILKMLTNSHFPLSYVNVRCLQIYTTIQKLWVGKSSMLAIKNIKNCNIVNWYYNLR